MICKRGDIVLVLYPDSNQRTARTRPALVVQADGLATGLPQVVVAMITSKMVRAGHPSRVTISLATAAGQQSGLNKDSVIMAGNIATVLESAIDRIIGAWPEMAPVDAALRHTLGL